VGEQSRDCADSIYYSMHWNNGYFHGLDYMLLGLEGQVVLSSLPPFMMFALVGSFLSYGSIFAWMPGFICKAACHIRVWFL